ncbi:MAG: glycosyltransferase, partial [Acidimicrobiales bacterium]
SKVESWGGHGVIVHEALPGWECPPPRRHQRLSVLVVGRLAADEPTGEVLAAARALPGCDFAITGEPTRLDPAVRSSAPPNVTFVGFLGKENYRDRLAASDAVVTLTTEPTSVMRAAYEAVYARRPVVLSDWPLCAELFPHALRCSNDSVGIADALRRLDADYESMVAKLDVARRRQVARWEGQRRKLEEKIAGSP